MKRLILLLISKLKSIFQKNVAFSSRVEFSVVSPKAKVWGHCKLFHSSVGDFSYVGPNTRLTYAEVGKFCSIAGEVIVGMGTHTLENLSTSPIFTEEKNGTSIKWINKTIAEPFRKVLIDNDVWIGSRVMVMGGVHIGNGAVVGAGAIVTKDVPPYAVVAGVPAKIIRYRFSPDEIIRLEKVQWWNINPLYLKKKVILFQSDVINWQELEELANI